MVLIGAGGILVGEIARTVAQCGAQVAILDLLEDAAEQLYLSPRACHRILKVARTIADLDQADNISFEHLAEAIAFRRLSLATDVYG